MSETKAEDAKAAALRLLAARDRSTQELRIRLERRFAPAEVEKRIQTVLQAPAMPESWERRRAR